MESFYVLTFGALAIACAALEVRKRPTSGKGASLPANFLAFRTNYLVVYALMMAGDWLQGPYVYALYKHYGIRHRRYRETLHRWFRFEYDFRNHRG